MCSAKDAVNPSDETEIPKGAAALTAMAALPLLRRGVWLVGTDSHDVTGGNNDGFRASYSYLRREGEEYVLFEESGPGCIYEIRTIGFRGDLRVYLDGAAAPRCVIPFNDLYRGDKAPFVAPLVAGEETAHGSSWSYVPIAYRKGCRLTTNEMAPPKFFNIFAHKYAEGTEVSTFDPAASLDRAVRVWSAPDRAAQGAAELEETRASATISPRQTICIAEVAGGGAIRRLKLRPVGGAGGEASSGGAESAGYGPLEDMAAHLVLRAYWDGEVSPQVNAPVGSFFGLGCPRALRAQAFRATTPREGKRHVTGRTPTLSLAVGRDGDGWLYCNLPMPFWKSARIELFNSSDRQTFECEYVVDCARDPYPAVSGYLHAVWREENPLRPGEDFCVVDTRGHGHFIGCVITFSTIDQDSPYRKDHVRGHLEGDARFYVDDVRTPLVASTGTEEYFNWGWYDLLKHDATFSYPTHGYPLHVADNQDHSVMYRFHLTDLAPYYRSFRFDLEHGPTGRTPAHYSGAAFFYQRSAPALVLTDEIDVGDTASEESHAYVCEGEVARVQHILPYEGSHQMRPAADAARDREHAVKDVGRVWEGACEFTVRIDPKNAGVKVRRRSYYAFGAEGDLGENRPSPVPTAPQAVSVSVDDGCAGEWRQPPCHARATWLDTDLEIPPALTRDKSAVRIRLAAQTGTRWDEYTYWAYSYLGDPAEPKE